MADGLLIGLVVSLTEREDAGDVLIEESVSLGDCCVRDAKFSHSGG